MSPRPLTDTTIPLTPAQLDALEAITSASSVLRLIAEVHRWRATGNGLSFLHADADATTAPFNHTRADGPYDPCPECVKLMSKADLVKVVEDWRTTFNDRRVYADEDTRAAALREIATNAESLLAGGLPHFGRREFAETVAHAARHALGEPVSSSNVTVRAKLRYNDGRVGFVDRDDVHLDENGKAPRFLEHAGERFEWSHNRRTIDGRFIYDEVGDE